MMMEEITMTPRYHPSAAAVENRLGDLCVLMHLDTSAVFRLDPVGTRVWELLCEGTSSLGGICAALRRDYGDIGAELEEDIGQLLDQLVDRGLVAAQ